MKKFYFLFLTIGLAISSISCSSDDDNGTETSDESHLTIDGVSYELEAGVITDYGASSFEDSYNFDITLFDSGINLSNGDFSFDEEIVNSIYFELWSESSSDLSTGTYTQAYTEAPFTYTYGDITLNYSINDDEASEYIEIASGDVVVLQNGSTYEISFEGTTEDGSEVSAYYKGALTSF